MKKSNIFGSNPDAEEEREYYIDQVFEHAGVKEKEEQEKILAMFTDGRPDNLPSKVEELFYHIYRGEDIVGDCTEEELAEEEKSEKALWLLYCVACYNFDNNKCDAEEVAKCIARADSILERRAFNVGVPYKKTFIDQEREVYAFDYASENFTGNMFKWH